MLRLEQIKTLSDIGGSEDTCCITKKSLYTGHLSYDNKNSNRSLQELYYNNLKEEGSTARLETTVLPGNNSF